MAAIIALHNIGTIAIKFRSVRVSLRSLSLNLEGRVYAGGAADLDISFTPISGPRAVAEHVARRLMPRQGDDVKVNAIPLFPRELKTRLQHKTVRKDQSLHCR